MSSTGSTVYVKFCGQNNAHHKDAHIPTPRIWGHVSLYGKRNFAAVIKLRILELGGYPVLSKWVHGSIKRKDATIEMREGAIHLEDGGSSGTKGCRFPPEAGKGKDINSPQILQKKHSPANTLILVP